MDQEILRLNFKGGLRSAGTGMSDAEATAERRRTTVVKDCIVFPFDICLYWICADVEWVELRFLK